MPDGYKDLYLCCGCDIQLLVSASYGVT